MVTVGVIVVVYEKKGLIWPMGNAEVGTALGRRRRVEKNKNTVILCMEILLGTVE